MGSWGSRAKMGLDSFSRRPRSGDFPAGVAMSFVILTLARTRDSTTRYVDSGLDSRIL